MKSKEFIQLEKDLVRATQKLRQACVDRGFSSSVSMAWYGGSITDKVELYVISELALRGDNSRYCNSFSDFLTKLEQFPPIKDLETQKTNFHKTNQELINQFKEEY